MWGCFELVHSCLLMALCGAERGVALPAVDGLTLRTLRGYKYQRLERGHSEREGHCRECVEVRNGGGRLLVPVAAFAGLLDILITEIGIFLKNLSTLSRRN